MPKPGSEGHGKSGHLSDRLRRKAPRRYFTFTFNSRKALSYQNNHVFRYLFKRSLLLSGYCAQHTDLAILGEKGYKLFDETLLSYPAAKNECANAGMRLATFKTETEYEAVKSLISKAVL